MRRILRYSLRTFLVLLTVLCLWLGWQVNRAKHRLEAIKAVQEMGGYYELDGGWLQYLTGLDAFADVVYVTLMSRDVIDVAPLAKLSSLDTLYPSR